MPLSYEDSVFLIVFKHRVDSKTTTPIVLDSYIVLFLQFLSLTLISTKHTFIVLVKHECVVARSSTVA